MLGFNSIEGEGGIPLARIEGRTSTAVNIGSYHADEKPAGVYHTVAMGSTSRYSTGPCRHDLRDAVVRAAVFQGAGQKLAIEQVPDPTPAERQIVVQVESCGICGTDLSLTSGHGFLQCQPGDVPGHEYCGQVVAVGPGVERLAVGDRVSALAIWSCCGRCESCRTGNEGWCTGEDKVVGTASAFAEYALLGEPQAVKLRDELSWEDGAMVEPLAVGLHGVDLSDLRPGTDIAVLGAGPIALAAVYWARRRGAGRIVVVATSTRRERFARQLGATDFVTGDNPVEAVVELTGGPPRLVIEAAGVPGSLATSMNLVAPAAPSLSSVAVPNRTPLCRCSR